MQNSVDQSFIEQPVLYGFHATHKPISISIRSDPLDRLTCVLGKNFVLKRKDAPYTTRR